MSENIVLPENEGDNQEEELKYQATEKDEEEFFLMYQFNWAPSEVKALDDDYRQWLIARFVHQKETERAMFENAAIARQIGPQLHTP